ncbi:MAG TPA: hypothetical protein VMT17_14430 [Anaeromyxobacteraceae bacterium]|nr:hypothetical protein [Anaeromyxobacteraceae bacterium]
MRLDGASPPRQDVGLALATSRGVFGSGLGATSSRDGGSRVAPVARSQS